MKNQKERSVISTFLDRDILLLLALMLISRLIPHWPNFTALGAVSILAPRWLKQNKLALVIPMIALLISDSILGFHPTMYFTYGSIFLVSLLSWKSQKTSVSGFSEITVWSFKSSIIFYLITNFGAWLTLDMYSKTTSDLILSYINGLPFIFNDFMGTMIYSGVALFLHKERTSVVSVNA